MPGLPDNPLGWGLLAVVVIVITWFILDMFGRDWVHGWRRRHPIDRAVKDGPWRGGFLEESKLRELTALRMGLPLGLHGGQIVRYAKNDERGWLGGHHAVIAGTRGGKGVSALIPAIIKVPWPPWISGAS